MELVDILLIITLVGSISAVLYRKWADQQMIIMYDHIRNYMVNIDKLIYQYKEEHFEEMVACKLRGKPMTILLSINKSDFNNHKNFDRILDEIYLKLLIKGHVNSFSVNLDKIDDSNAKLSFAIDT